jgi:transposase|tara:strand:- start:2151 stop:2879 length:729 start_codon:yes stop_codon:yes gene_type:complete
MAGVRQKKHEKLDEANLDKVIELLESSSPITKKEACEILNISYNTTRLNKILEEHKDVMSYRATRKAQNKGKRATELEIKQTVQAYLDGDNISDIAKQLFRSSTFVRNIIQSVGVPEKLSKEAHSKVYRHKWAVLPEQCMADEFEVGERVWSVRDNCIAIIKREITVDYMASMPGYTCYGNAAECIDYEKRDGAKGYQIYTIEEKEIFSPIFGYMQNVGRNSFALAYDLGRLKHLEQYGVKV